MTRVDSENEIVLTPNYAGIFDRMMRDIEAYGPELFSEMPEHDADDVKAKRDALAALQRVLAPLNIAVQCMTTAEQVGRVREALSAIVTSIDTRRSVLDNDLEGRE